MQFAIRKSIHQKQGPQGPQKFSNLKSHTFENNDYCHFNSARKQTLSL